MDKLRQAAWTAIHKINRSTGFDEESDNLLMEAASVLRKVLAELDIEEMTLTQIAARHEQAEQEPVSISDLRAEHHKAMLAYDIAIKYGLYERNAFKLCDEMKKLYAAPVRTKDLTDDEISAVFKEAIVMKPVGWMGFARAVITADREKNK